MWPWWVMIPIEDLTDVTLAIEEVMKVIKRWKLSSDGSYEVMKVMKWWKLSSDESYQVIKVIKWWKLSSDESYQMMKVIKSKKWKVVIACDVSPVAMFICHKVKFNPSFFLFFWAYLDHPVEV